VADYIKFPVDFFDLPEVKMLRSFQWMGGDNLILIYLHLLCTAYQISKKGIYTIGKIELTDEVMEIALNDERIGEKLKILDEYGFITRNVFSIEVHKIWIDRRDRNSPQYRDWRMAVMQRDGFMCQECGCKKDIQAHHIKPWKDNKLLRYEVSNGITLCRPCHLKAHGGDWRGRKKDVRKDHH